MQDVLAKVYRSLQQAPDRQVSKAFLRQIAKNAWIDHCRRLRGRGASTVFDEDMHATPFGWNDMLIRESLEQLADQLNPRQLVLILVMDVFQFSAPETAQLLHTTVGAVKDGLKRARHRLQTLAAQAHSGDRKDTPVNKPKMGPEMSKAAFEQFLAGFRDGDPEAICRTYMALAANGIQVEKVTRTAGSYYLTFRDPSGHLIGFFQEI